VKDAERSALSGDGCGERSSGELSVVSVALGSIQPGGRPRGLITVGRNRRQFSSDDRDLLVRSLAAQATLALENVQLDLQVTRQAVTDELTGLANHGGFQDLFSVEMEQVRRCHHSVGLIMLDIDDFKSVNDTFRHQQGDVLRTHVVRVLRESSREAETAGSLPWG
jgi:GGDEF domain-containing protein